MFPLDTPTVIFIVLVGSTLFSALALQFRWRRRIALLLLAVALPAGFLWSDPPTGQTAAVAFSIAIVVSVGVLFFGCLLGAIIRSTLMRTLTSVAVLSVAATAVTGGALWRQYVPIACLESPLQVRIAGNVLSLPHALQPRLESGDNVALLGRTNFKTDYARICRMSRNGERTIDMDTVWISPASNYTAMTSACNVNEPPAWCDNYSSEPYRRMGGILIAPDTDHDFPLPYWREGGSLKTDRQGDLTEGSVCLVPDAGDRTQCWVWQTFGTGSRLTVSTSNLDRTFEDMPVEEARELIRQAREMTLAIIEQ